MKSYTYLLIDFFTIIVPFIFSFHPKLKFHQTWKAFFPAVAITGLLFILWDVYFTSLGVWGFNPDYLIGIQIANLPLEEILFFLCIPYACVFTFHCLNLIIKNSVSQQVERYVTLGMIVFSLIMACCNLDQIYTSVTFFLLASMLILAKYILKVGWLGKFYLIYGILLFPFLIVNGLLTGTGLDAPVVWYDEQQILGFRILTIPFEDVFYGMSLILINLLIYLYLKRISNK